MSELKELYEVEIEDSTAGGTLIKVRINSPQVVYHLVPPSEYPKKLTADDLNLIYARRVAVEYTERIYETVKEALENHLRTKED